ncbi:hypothetical protein D0Z03_002010 [Geotrichum reessii]|nr:hypothetical protein D0Z03_002010 [Galactomyces reessii]
MSAADVTFESLGLDPRLNQAITRLQFSKPTLVQATAIPLALEQRKDIIARARTGSGKTVAYAIPVIESILQEEQAGNRAIVLVPSKELADQVTKLFKSLTIYCGKTVGVVNAAASEAGDAVLKSLLAAKPAVVVGTPSRLLAHIKSGAVDAKGISYLVIDEADLILSYGYEDDLKGLAEILPVKKTAQAWIMSATLSDEVEDIKQRFCRSNLAVLKLDEEESGSSLQQNKNNLLQYYVKCGELDKFLLAYVIFKLNLIKGKTLIFVNDIDRSYRLKLFFEQFGIKSCVLNAELPIASRLHIVDEFNKNVYKILIATDENTHYVKDGEADEEDEEENKEELKETEIKEENKDGSNKKKKGSKHKKDSEFSVSRGVDFQNIACVLNFDLPTSSTVYTHRIGRTARGNNSGMALSFVVPRDQFLKHRSSSSPTAKRDEKILARVMKSQERRRKRDLKNLGVEDYETNTQGQDDAGVIIQPYVFDMKQVEVFRYRMEDAFRAITKVAIREARIKEIRQELLASEKLKRHFEENPDDLISLRHDRELHSARVQTHLKRVPEYLMPQAANAAQAKKRGDLGFISLNKQSDNRIRKAHSAKRARGKGQKKRDPLKNFNKK